MSIMVPDKNGQMQDVVLGFDSIADYINVPSDFGASIGRYANRINQGRFVLDGDTIQLPQNNYGHCFHLSVGRGRHDLSPGKDDRDSSYSKGQDLQDWAHTVPKGIYSVV